MYTVIVVDYNTIEKTIAYVKMFAEKCYQKVHFIIIDNSNDNQEKIIVNHFDYVKTITCCEKQLVVTNYKGIHVAYCYADDNLGYAKGNNLGAEINKELFDSPYIIFSNNDISFVDTIDLSKFKKVFEGDQTIAIIGPNVIDLNNKRQNPRKKISAFKNLILQYWGCIIPKLWGEGDIDNNDISRKCYWTSGCFLFVEAKKFYEINGFDSNTFLYAEEMILSERLAKKGYGYYFLNDITLFHEEGGTTSQSMSAIGTMERMLDSNCYFYKEYRNTSDLLIKIAKLNFKLLFNVFYPMYKKIKK